MVSVSVASTGMLSNTDEDGNFKINVPDYESEIIIELPGYIRRRIFLNGRESLTITLVPLGFKTFDSNFDKPLGDKTIKDEVYSISSIEELDLDYKNAPSFDLALQGMVPGLHIIQQSGLPGQKSFVNIRGFNSLVARNEPLLIIDGMIHDHNYANYGVMEGHSLNPLDIVDIEDIANITIIKAGDAYWGSAGSNGMLYVNTEQKSEASTLIKISASSGVSFSPRKLKVLGADQFNNYFVDYLNSQGYSGEMREKNYPWLANKGAEKYRYNNNTDWQGEVFEPGLLQKYHIFLKGGDDIATYNISAGYIKQDGSYENQGYNRFNLRVNGKVNISQKFAITPNVKLSLSDTYTANHGPTVAWNPLISSILKPAIMAPNARDESNGDVLPYTDNTGAFNVSNPVAIIQNAVGVNRNYHFLSSVNAEYKINDNFTISNLLGINFNNARENIFIPNNGIVQIDSAANSPKDFVYEFRSTQNHTTLSYNKKTDDGKSINIHAGMRLLANSYKHNIVIDLNTPSDDFKKLGDGSRYNYLRQSLGDNRNLAWVSYFANGDYSIKNKYFFNANLSVDGSSAINPKNRYNIFPSLGGAWRLSSEEFLCNNTNIEDLKLRASWSMTGNMYSSVYDYSRLYYNEKRLGSIGILTREAIPNEDLEIEKTSTFNIGLDYSGKQQLTNMNIDLYYARTNNLIIKQQLPVAYGYTDYYDNGGSLSNMGLELGINHIKRIGDVVMILGATASTNLSSINKLNFINPEVDKIITNVEGAQYVTSKGNAINAFYGYETNGIFKSNEEASKLIGPKGRPMEAGDIKFVDKNGDGQINELDKTTIGNPNPYVFGAMYATAKYKRWEAKAVFTYNLGNEAFNYVRFAGESMDTYASQLATTMDRWTSNNTNGSLPRSSFGDPTGNAVFSDRWIEDASYLKLKQFTVTYSFPHPLIQNDISVYLTASNLFTLTRYSGYDPEFYYLNDPFYMGIDYGKMPQPRSFIIGVKLNL
jgi:TonB-linked SusC/RagA family outer membrane protein